VQFYRYAGSKYFLSRAIRETAALADERLVRVACVPYRDPGLGNDVLTLADEWPGCRIAIWAAPLAGDDESFPAAFARRVAPFLEVDGNQPSQFRLKVIYSDSIEGDARSWLKTDDGGTLLESFDVLIEGWSGLGVLNHRYRIECLKSTAKATTTGLTLLAADLKNRALFHCRGEDASLDPLVCDEIVNIYMLDDDVAIRFGTSSTPDEILGFGGDQRITDLYKDEFGTTIARAHRFALCADVRPNGESRLTLNGCFDPHAASVGVESVVDRCYFELVAGEDIVTNLPTRSNRPLILKAVEHDISSRMAPGTIDRRPPRFYVTKQVKPEPIVDATLNWQTLSLDGAFAPRIELDGTARRTEGDPVIEVYTGLSEREYIAIGADSKTGEPHRFVFKSGAPGFAPSDLATAATAGAGRLTSKTTTSWLAIETASGADPATLMVSEGPEYGLMNGTGGGSRAGDALVLSHDPLFLGWPNEAADSDSPRGAIPVFPYAYGSLQVRGDVTPESASTLEQATIQLHRRALLKPAGISASSLLGLPDRVATEAPEVRITPLGLLVELDNNQKIKAVILWQKDDLSVKLIIKNDELADALMRDRLCLITDDLHSLGTIEGQFKLGDWTLRVKLGPDQTSASGKMQKTYVLFKDDGRTLKTLIDDPKAWAGKEALGITPEKAEKIQADIRAFYEATRASAEEAEKAERLPQVFDRILGIYDEYTIGTAAMTGRRRSRRRRTIKALPDWRGILLLNLDLALGTLPDQLMALAPLLEGLKAHHIGIDFNRVDGEFNIKSAPVFGLIEHEGSDQKPGEAKYDGKGEAGWGLALQSLIVRFENGSVAGFAATILFSLRNLFYTPIKGIGRQGLETIRIDGSFESRLEEGAKKDIYTFVSPNRWDFELEDGLVRTVTILRLTYSTTSVDDSTPGQKKVISRFSADGEVAFRAGFPSADFELLPIFEKVAFRDLGIDLNFDLTLDVNGEWDLGDLAFTFSPRSLEFDFKSLGKGLFGNLPFKFRRFQWFDKPSTLGEVGYFGFGRVGNFSDWFRCGLHFDLDVGSLGKLGEALKNFKMSTLLGWDWDPDAPEVKFKLSFGFKFEGSDGEGLEIGLGNVLKIKADKYDIVKRKVGNKDFYFIYALNARIVILGRSMPGGGQGEAILNVFLFIDPKGDFNELGWLGVLSNFGIEGIVKLPVMALGQRIDPFVSDPGERPTVKTLVDFIQTELGDASGDEQKKLNDPKDPDPDGIIELLDPNNERIKFAPSSTWTVGGRAAIAGDVVGLDFVVRDPDLYGIRVALPVDGSFFSLDIAYRKLTRELGVYTGGLVPPPAIRQIELGAASVTLAVIGFEIFTDGGFTIDFGYPKDRDFRRSFSVQVLPFIGSGGFFYQRVSGVGQQLIPRPKNKHWEYNPVTAIGIGFRVGLGKEIVKGPLRAGLSVTVYGYLVGAQGVLRETKEPDEPTAMPRSTYMVLRGAVGVLGEVYGYIDFGIVKAGVEIVAFAEIGIVLETDRATLLYIEAGVAVRVEVVIARFKVFGETIEIKVCHSFSTTLSYSWKAGVDRDGWERIYSRQLERPEYALTEWRARALGAATLAPIDFTRIPEPKHWRDDAKKVGLVLTFAPDVTVGMDEDVGRLVPEAVILLTAPCRPPQQEGGAGVPPTGFERLVQGLAVWALYASEVWDEEKWPTIILTAEDYRRIGHRLAGESQDESPGDGGVDRTPSIELLRPFLKTNFDVALRNTLQGDLENHFLVAAPPDLSIVRIGLPGEPVLNLWELGLVDPTYERLVEETFRCLFLDQRQNRALRTMSAKPVSAVVFEEYMGLLMRAAIDRLEQIARDHRALTEDPLSFMDALARLAPARDSTTDAIPASEIGAFTTRAFLHGLTLPAPPVVPEVNGRPVLPPTVPMRRGPRGTGLQASGFVPLYRLAWLQVPLFRGSSAGSGAVLGLDIRSGPEGEWLRLENANEPIRSKELDPQAHDALKQAAGELDALVEALDLSMEATVVRSRAMEWPAGERLDVWAPGEPRPREAVWRLPSDVIELVMNWGDDARRDLTLCVRERANRGPAADLKEVGGIEWVSAVELKIRQIERPAATPASESEPTTQPLEHVYELGGMSEAMRRFLDSIVECYYPVDRNTPPCTQTVQVRAKLFAPRLGSNQLFAVEDAILLQTNLSAEPHPDQPFALLELPTEQQSEYIARVAEPAHGLLFAEIARRAAIVNTGGYFLYTASPEVPKLFHREVGEGAVTGSDPHLLLVLSFVTSEGQPAEPPAAIYTNALRTPWDGAFDHLDAPRDSTRTSLDSIGEWDWDAAVLRVATSADVSTSPHRIDEPIHRAGTLPVRVGRRQELLPRLRWSYGASGRQIVVTGTYDEIRNRIMADLELDPTRDSDLGRLRVELRKAGLASTELAERFHMLSYGIEADEQQGISGLDYGETLPIGPTPPYDEKSASSKFPLDSEWGTYDFVVPIRNLLKVDPGELSTYRVVGKNVTINYTLRDIYGNSVQRKKSCSYAVKYVDRILPISDLPHLLFDWQLVQRGADWRLELEISARASALASRDAEIEPGGDTWAEYLDAQLRRAAEARSQYRTAAFQTDGPYYTIGISSSLTGRELTPLTVNQRKALLRFLNEAIERFEEIEKKAVEAKENPDAWPISVDQAAAWGWDVAPAPEDAIDFKLAKKPEDLEEEEDAKWFVEITVLLQQQRQQEWVVGAPPSAQMLKVVNPVAPRFRTEKDAQAQQAKLAELSAALEEAFSGFAPATGLRRRVGAADEAMWLVSRDVLAMKVPGEWKTQGPVAFAVPPLSTKLESYDVSVQPYNGQWQPVGQPVAIALRDVDADIVGRTAVERIDRVLSPDIFGRLVGINNITGAPGALSAVLEAKKVVAERFAARAINILAREDESPDRKNRVSEAVTAPQGPVADRFKRRLSTVYEVDTVLAWALDGGPESQTDEGAPLLHGEVRYKDADGANAPIASFAYDPAVISVAKDQGQLTIVFDAQSPVPKKLYRHRLSFRVLHVQRKPWPTKWNQFDPDLKRRYRSTSWLRLLRPIEIDLYPNNATTTEIPVPRREFPQKASAVAIDVQKAYEELEGNNNLTDRLRRARMCKLPVQWSWRPVENDVLRVDVEYDFAPGGERALRSTRAAFESIDYAKRRALAQFVQSTDLLWPAILAFASGGDSNLAGAVLRFGESAADLQKEFEQPVFIDRASTPATHIDKFGTEEKEEIAGQWKLAFRAKELAVARDAVIASDASVPKDTLARRRVDLLDVDLLKARNAWPRFELTRNEFFNGQNAEARDEFVYTAPIVRPGEATALRLDRDDRIDIERDPPWSSMAEALEEFFKALLTAKDGQIPADVIVDAEYAYLTGLFEEFPGPQNGWPGTLIGKMLGFAPKPKDIADTLGGDEGVITRWLRDTKVLTVGNGWRGGIRLRVALSLAPTEAKPAPPPFLRLNHCVLSLTDIVGVSGTRRRRKMTTSRKATIIGQRSSGQRRRQLAKTQKAR
jgi:hypothetical protein